MEAKSPCKSVLKKRILRCADWLQKQHPVEYSTSEEKDVKFVPDDEFTKANTSDIDEEATTIPDGIDEDAVHPVKVPIHRLRLDKLHIQCEWPKCQWATSNYEEFQKHVRGHISHVRAVEMDGQVQYSCLWDICGFKTTNFDQMIRHINYHAYHAKLMAVGFNGRATLKLMRCKKDSSKRNVLPELLTDHQCMWVGCMEKFNSIQVYFDHIHQHISYSETALCSWAGCGAAFPRRTPLYTHVRSHCGERLIACCHCGTHFANNRKLADHLRRQNADASSGHACSMCGMAFASEYLMREHARRHVSVYACALCDMTAPSLASLASHVAYRHMDNKPENRMHRCPHCEHRSVTKWDMRKHIQTHDKRKHKRKDTQDETSESDSETPKKKKVLKKYICHLCPKNMNKLFTRGSKLTIHLVKVHGAQWPYGHSRFRYQISEDGLYRLTTTRYESLEISKKLVDGNSGPQKQITSDVEFEIAGFNEATPKKPKEFVIKLKNQDVKNVEIEMCDVDEQGNIIRSKVIKSDVVYT